MRHVDEGTIHAWLDQQVTDPQEVAWITAHLRECATCSARVADEEATIRDAEALLSSVAPYADGSREAFEALVAGAGQRNGAERVTPGGGATKSGSYPWWIVSAGWAATIALAVGLGWSARYLMSSRSAGEQAPVSPAAAQQMARADSRDREIANPGAEPPRAAAGVAPTAQPPSGGQRVAPSPGTAPKSTLPSRAADTKQAPSEITGERVPAEASSRPGAGPDTVGQSPDATARSLPSLLGLVPSAPQAAPPPPLALPFRAESVEVTAEAPVVDVQNARQQVTPPAPSVSAEAPVVESARAAAAPSEPTAAGPAPAAPAAGGGRGGGRGGAGRGGGAGGAGGRAGGGRVTGAGGGQFAGGFGAGNGVGPAAPSPATDGLNQGRILVDGVLISSTERADGIDWLVLPREAARERSGMPLYGIDGLTPARTMVNAEGSKVRTVYVLNAAEVVLLQEKQPAREQTQERTRSQDSSATADTVPTSRPGGDAAAAPAPQRGQAEGQTRWSSVRNDVVLTVQGVDAAGLGARVRLD